MRKINGHPIEEVDEVGEGLRQGCGARRISGGTGPLISAACNDFFLRRGLPVNRGDFRQLNQTELEEFRAKQRRTRRRA